MQKNNSPLQKKKKEQTSPETVDLHHYVQLFYLWFPQNITNFTTYNDNQKKSNQLQNENKKGQN